jgi:gas vesicle protein
MNRDVALGILVGLAAGFGLGCLVAPRSGEQTRSLLAKQAKRAARSAREQADDLVDTASGFVDDGRDLLAKQQAVVSDAINRGKKVYRSVAG